MTTGKLSSTFLILLLLCVKYGHSGVKKIKIHVPYYVKHVHHFKKVYVPKVHVIKHEHHHKKEYDHHHHHHDVFKHGPYKTYKSSHEFPDEVQHHDVHYDDLESKFFYGVDRKRTKPLRYRSRSKEQYRGWRDVDGSDYSGEEEEDYSAYRRNFYFKRRLDKGEGDEEGDEEEEEEEEQEMEKEEENDGGGGEEESEEEEENSEESMSPSDNKAEIISITTTEPTLQ